MLGCLKKVIKVHLNLQSGADGKIVTLQTIHEETDGSFAYYSVRLRLEQADRLVYLGCRRQVENRSYETEAAFGGHQPGELVNDLQSLAHEFVLHFR